MPQKKRLTIFGATGNQGGSILTTYLSRPDLQSTYTLRGITRDPSSPKSQALASKGVEMVRADLNDPASLQTAIKSSYGVFGVTDFWAVMSKEVEVRQGRNIFEACKAEGVRHFVWSSLPPAEKLTGGVLRHVEHFDSKAEVERLVEEGKGGMWASYFMPAMFVSVMRSAVKPLDGIPTLSLPFPSSTIAWPLFVPTHDAGPYVLGFFEAGSAANGAHAHAVSFWTTPAEVVSVLSKEAGREIRWKSMAPEEYQGGFKDAVLGLELVETMRLVGEYSYYGKGEEGRQGESDRWLLRGAEKMGLKRWVQENGPWASE